MARKLTARGEERRAQLVAYAAQRFAADGYDPTSVADIVDGLGVGKGVFYWYFQSKEELFLEILAHAQRGLRRRQREAIGDAADPITRLELGIRGTLEFFDDHRDFWRLVQVATHDRRFTGAMRAGQEVAVSDTSLVIRDAMDAGQIPDGDPDLLSHAVLGVLNHVGRVYLFRGDRSAEEIADDVVTFCIGGVVNRASSATP